MRSVAFTPELSDTRFVVSLLMWYALTVTVKFDTVSDTFVTLYSTSVHHLNVYPLFV